MQAIVKFQREKNEQFLIYYIVNECEKSIGIWVVVVTMEGEMAFVPEILKNLEDVKRRKCSASGTIVRF